MKKIFLCICCLACLMTASISLAGWEFDQLDAGENREKVFVQAGFLRHEGRDSVVIMNTRAGTMCLINPLKKNYWCGPPEQLKAGINEQLKGGPDGELDQTLNEQLKKLPPEKRAEVRQALKKKLAAKKAAAEVAERYRVVVKDGDLSDEVAGYRAHKHEIWVDGLLRQELWVAPKVAVAGEVDLFKLQQMIGIMQPGSGSGWRCSDEVMALWKRGYPLITVDFVGGRSRMTEVITATKKKLPASLFKPPRDYKPVSVTEALRP